MIQGTVRDIDGQEVDLADWRGKALLIVNVASKCGYTKQYASLQELYETYRDRGFEVLGFPCNDFGGQEPGSEETIKEFCSTSFGVEFPMFSKITVKGDEKEPLYRMLTEETSEEVRGEIRWNFTKFLIDPDGEVVARFEPTVDPMSRPVTDALSEILPTPQ